MRKTLAVLVLVGLAFVLVAGPVLAAGSDRDTVLAAKKGPYKEPTIISFTGRVAAATSPGATTIMVTVQMTNKPFLARRGDTIAVITNNTSTVYVDWDEGTRERLTSLPALAIGRRVSVNARVTQTANGTTYIARRFELDKPRYP